MGIRHEPPLLPSTAATIIYMPVTEIPPDTACKHGRMSCERCGTDNRRDVLHTTTGGRGVVARLRRR